MKIIVEVDDKDLRRMALDKIVQMTGAVDLKLEDVKFQVKSKNNYRPQEWEEGILRIVVDRSI